MEKGVKKLINELRKEGLIIVKPTHYGEEISLNPRKKDKIMEMIKKFFEINI
jgi:hypothetical protein